MKKTIYILLVAGMFFSCEDFLEEKSDRSIVVPTTPVELQALLDNDIMSITSGLGMVGSDDYYLTEAAYATLGTQIERNGYLWKKDVFEGRTPSDWEDLYNQIFYTNVVLEAAQKLDEGEEKNFLIGQALFLRSYYAFDLLQIFAAPYEVGVNDNAPGIPIKQTADVNEPIFRAPLSVCYEVVESDIKKALGLLPSADAYKTRADKASAYGFLARYYLTIEEYELAKVYADSSLSLHNTLINYNDYDETASRPFGAYNEEVIFHSTQVSYGIRSRLSIAPELIELYEPEDLRLSLLFSQNPDGSFSHKGSYGERTLFSGIATDEIYLIRAECNARSGNYEAAMDDINTILSHRYRSGTYEEKTAGNANEALAMVLEERRKELALRGLRWHDLRRLNKDPELAKDLTRTFDGKIYELPANDKRYVYPIPSEEVRLTGMIQNER